MQLTKEARLWRVRSKRLLCAGMNERGSCPLWIWRVTGSKIKMLIEKLVLIFKNFCGWHIADPKYYESRATITSCASTAEYVPAFGGLRRHLNRFTARTLMRRASHCGKPPTLPGRSPRITRTERAVRFKLDMGHSMPYERLTSRTVESNCKITFVVIRYNVFPVHLTRLVASKIYSRQQARESQQDTLNC